jgi:AraC-like DNA-binding protein
MLREMEQHAGVAGHVGRLLIAQMGEDTSLEAVSARLQLPPRTVRRRLQREGTSFRDLSAQLRKEMALRCLRDTELTVEDIACALGFSDAANFRHAFRGWTGVCPQEMRHRLRAGERTPPEEARCSPARSRSAQILMKLMAARDPNGNPASGPPTSSAPRSTGK